MATQVLMPQMGLTMTEGLLTEWLKKEGEAVHKGDALFCIENDKATLTVEAQADGVLSNVSVQAMETVPVGTVVALILAEGEKAGNLPKAPPKKAAPASEAVPAPAAAAPVQPAAQVPSKAAQPAAPVPAASSDGFILASPRARSLARAAKLDLGSLRGSGPEGAVLERDLPASAREAAPEAEIPARGPEAPGTPAGGLSGGPEPFELVTLPRIGRVGAQRMAESWREIPQFTLYADANAEALIRFNEQSKKNGKPVSITVLLAGLLARALRDYPRLNASWAGNGTVRTYKAVHVGIAMDTPDGLVVPVLRDCAAKGMGELAKEMAALADKGKNRALGPDELSGGPITLSNLGMFGVKRFRAIVNPPQTAILAVGALDRRPVENEAGGISFQRFLGISVTADHRAVDGAYAAKFLSAFRELIENPMYALF